MTSEQLETMEEFLTKENDLLDEILKNQAQMRVVVNERNWEKLVTVTANLEDLSNRFAKIETAREALACEEKNMSAEMRGLLRDVRGKLVKSQAENKALGEYVSIMQGFVKGVIEESVPQGRNKLYGSNGAFLAPKTSSLLVNRLF